MKRSISNILIAAIVGSAGYAASVSAQPYGYAEPDLVVVAPGVQVIADYDAPIFYSDNVYWRFYNNRWFRSPYYTGGWVVANPPRAVRGIHHPGAYAHYRPRGWHARRAPGPIYSHDGPVRLPDHH